MREACAAAGHHVTAQRARQIFRHLAERHPELLTKAEGTRWSYDTVPPTA